MPEQFAKSGHPCAFIWYHADAKLAGQLSDWVRETSDALGISGRLLIRQQTNKTTFMEIYPSIDETSIERIEKAAAAQSWFAQLTSPRQAEVFKDI
ncbi:MAG: DUF4936 family protein [Mariprofundaceae bacterium]